MQRRFRGKLLEVDRSVVTLERIEQGEHAIDDLDRRFDGGFCHDDYLPDDWIAKR